MTVSRVIAFAVQVMNYVETELEQVLQQLSMLLIQSL